MENLIGHLYPGTFFALVALWQSFMVAFRHVLEKNNIKTNKICLRRGILVPYCPFGLQRLPLMSISKCVFAVFGILANISVQRSHEMNEETHEHMHARGVNTTSLETWYFEAANAQHATMFAALGLTGFLEILVHYNYNLPKDLEYLCDAMSFSIEGFLFGFHLHGRNQLSTQIHTFLLISIFMCVFCCILEYRDPSNILFTYGRIVFLCLQGTWFWEAGFILHPPFESLKNAWDPNNHDHLMLITVSFVWHFLTIVVLLCIQLLMMHRYYSSKNLKFYVYGTLQKGDDDSNQIPDPLNENSLAIERE
jgi:hypothetical protein